MTIGLVDYGLGNLGSVENMLRRVGAQTRRVSTADALDECDKVLLPGVGSFDTGMAKLAERGLDGAIVTFARSGRPLLGICLGMQLLLDASDEGSAAGLGLIPGRSVRFPTAPGLRVPHMGWNRVFPSRPDPLTDSIPTDNRFYFVHSYHVVPNDPNHVLATARYGTPFAAMVKDGNVAGAQFHPEKSHSFGKALLKDFAAA